MIEFLWFLFQVYLGVIVGFSVLFVLYDRLLFSEDETRKSMPVTFLGLCVVNFFSPIDAADLLIQGMFRYHSGQTGEPDETD